jgi:hypothetical protein
LEGLLKSKNVFKRFVIHEETKLSKLSRNSIPDEDTFQNQQNLCLVERRALRSKINKTCVWWKEECYVSKLAKLVFGGKKSATFQNQQNVCLVERRALRFKTSKSCSFHTEYASQFSKYGNKFQCM